MSAQKITQGSVTISKHATSYSGYTLFAPLGGKDVWLIDMRGCVVHQWSMPYPPGLYGVLLESGNLLYAGRVNDSPLANFEGAGGALLEVDWDGNPVWKYEDKYMHHTFYRMKNGNTMIVKWVPVPDNIAAKVKGGLPGTELEGVMWADAFQEVTVEGKVAWEWLAYEHLDPEVDYICPLCQRDEWTHASACVVMPDGNILTSFSKTHTVAIIDKNTGEVRWRWGRGEIAHQNDSIVLRNGNILIFDNDVHATPYSMGFSRILEVNPKTNEMVWSYEDELRTNFYSSIMGSCQRLPNGNTLICETTTGRIFEVSPKRDIVWEFNNPFSHQSPVYGRNNYIARAYRYGPDYAGLKGNIKFRDEDEPQVKDVDASRAEQAVRRRIDGLGY